MFGQCFLDSMIPRHLSANWQYCRQAADGSGRFHSAPQLGHVVLSSSLQISRSPWQTWHWMYEGFGCRRSRSPGQVSGFFSILSLELNYFTSNLNLVFFNWNLFARAFKRLVYCPLQTHTAGHFHMDNRHAGNDVLFKDFS